MANYFVRVWVGSDHLVNALTGGSPWETVSSRVGRAALTGSKVGKVLEKVINTLVFWRPNHCRRAITNVTIVHPYANG